MRTSCKVTTFYSLSGALVKTMQARRTEEHAHSQATTSSTLTSGTPLDKAQLQALNMHSHTTTHLVQGHHLLHSVDDVGVPSGGVALQVGGVALGEGLGHQHVHVGVLQLDLGVAKHGGGALCTVTPAQS